MYNTQEYGARVNANKSWWAATIAGARLNGTPKTEQPRHANPEINAIHKNPNMTREEKLAAARAILNAEKEVKPVEVVEPATVETEAVETTKTSETKSKICVIANRLCKQGMNRPEAFRRAWQMVRAATIETNIAGVTYGKRQSALEHLTKYDANQISVNLERESANEYDANAIAVIITVTDKGSYTIGYIPRMLAAAVAPLIDAGKAVKAMFKEVRGKYYNYHNYGLAVSLSI